MKVQNTLKRHCQRREKLSCAVSRNTSPAGLAPRTLVLHCHGQYCLCLSLQVSRSLCPVQMALQLFLGQPGSPLSHCFHKKLMWKQKKEDQSQSHRPSLLSLGEGEERESKMQEGGGQRLRWERAMAVPPPGV